jgi:hypothetical protein
LLRDLGYSLEVSSRHSRLHRIAGEHASLGTFASSTIKASYSHTLQHFLNPCHSKNSSIRHDATAQ